jgi:predicted permease
MVLESIRNTGVAVIQTIMLAGIGYFLVRKNFIDNAGLSTLSRMVIEVTLPLLIFCQLAKEFSFSIYPNWWIFPLASMLVSIAGLAVGCVFIKYIKGAEFKKQFLSLIAFQNSGYLPIALVTALLPKDKLDSMLVYLFLFLMGFNLVIWSFGVYMLTFTRAKKFELGSLFSPPVVVTLFSLVFVFFGLPKVVPAFVYKPLRLIGDCTVPLAMLVVGGNLAQIHIRKVDKKAVFLILLSKMIILPLSGLWLVLKFGLPELIGLLIIMQLAVPPATSLSVIIRHYKKEDLLISQGIFWGHIVSILTIPLFLGLYFTRFMVK